MKPKGPLLLVAIVALGCAKSETVQSSDVITLAACPDGGECQTVADGAALITIEACIPTTVAMPLMPNLTVTMLASAGSWQNAPDKTQPGTYTASLSGNRCVRPTLVTPTNTLAVRVDATLAGYTSSKVIPLTAAALGTIELTAQPAIITSSTDQILIHATVRGAGLGTPTAGTTLNFQPTVEPSAVYVATFPSSSVLDSNFSAQTTAIVGPHVRSLTITATATGPTRPGASMPPPSVMNSITITATPPDGGATDGP
jgi:hypothetical protein